MLQKFIKQISINTIVLYITAVVLSDFFKISGGTGQLFFAALALTLLNITLRPLINLLMLPVNLVTLNLFRWINNVLILFVLTRLVKTISIQAYISPQIQIWNFTIPQLTFSGLGVFVLVSICISLIYQIIHWIFKDSN